MTTSGDTTSGERPGEAEAIEAAVRAYIAPDIWEMAHPGHHEIWRDGMRLALTAAYPVIAAAVREQAAQEIAAIVREVALRFGREYNADSPSAMAQDISQHVAARVVREGK